MLNTIYLPHNNTSTQTFPAQHEASLLPESVSDSSCFHHEEGNATTNLIQSQPSQTVQLQSMNQGTQAVEEARK